MIKTDLQPDLDWQRWQSNDEDIAAADPQAVRRMLFLTFLINEFEHAVLRLKNDDCVWGPVHSSIGQEAASAACVTALRDSDKILGTHRAHHQFLAKVVNHALPETWDAVSQDLTEDASTAVTRTLAEIMGLAMGYCGGRGGSMHLRCAEAGVVGTNAIVGGGVPLATGTAFAEKFNRTGNIVVCFLGDGAINQGSFHEACNLAGIWNLPIIYFVENNHYAVATSATDACAVKDMAVRAAAYGMAARTVDGMDAVAIHALVADTASAIRAGARPCVIECRCYRHFHHAGDRPGSAFGYRAKEEEAEWLGKDALAMLPEAAARVGHVKEQDVERMQQMARSAVAQAMDSCAQSGSPMAVRPELWPRADSVVQGLRSDGHEWAGVTLAEPNASGKCVDMKFSDAIAAVTGRWLEKDDRVVVLGEEVANFGGGAYGATKQLPGRFPDRVINTPISEAGFVGLACGAAMSGLRPVVEIMFPDFSLVAADQLFNQIGKLRHMYGNSTDMPLVARTRVAIGCGYGGQHSMDPSGLYALFPGWRIVYPSNALDYIGLFNSAMHSLDPVLVVEHHSLYTRKFPVPKGDLDYCIPFGKARVAAEGSDVTVIAYGSATGRCEDLLVRLAEQGISAEIVDLRTIDPPSIDYATISASVAKTGAAVVVEEAPRSQSIGAILAAEVTERCFDYLDGPVMRVNSIDVPNPVSRALESAVIVSDDEIASTVVAAARRR